MDGLLILIFSILTLIIFVLLKRKGLLNHKIGKIFFTLFIIHYLVSYYLGQNNIRIGSIQPGIIIYTIITSSLFGCLLLFIWKSLKDRMKFAFRGENILLSISIAGTLFMLYLSINNILSPGLSYVYNNKFFYQYYLPYFYNYIVLSSIVGLTLLRLLWGQNKVRSDNMTIPRIYNYIIIILSIFIGGILLWRWFSLIPIVGIMRVIMLFIMEAHKLLILFAVFFFFKKDYSMSKMLAILWLIVLLGMILQPENSGRYQSIWKFYAVIDYFSFPGKQFGFLGLLNGFSNYANIILVCVLLQASKKASITAEQRSS